jgi:hypothetical protein
MSKVYPCLDEGLKAFIQAQHVFFVATAPAGAGGHINVSPKGLDSLRVLGPTTLGYIDYVGSGVETIAHLRENGRIVIMLCAFEGSPRIVRLHGRGTVIEPQDAEFAPLAAAFERRAGERAIISIELSRISDSCGFGVPLYTYGGERPHLRSWATHRTADAIAAYQQGHNAQSIDGLSGLRWTEEPTHHE